MSTSEEEIKLHKRSFTDYVKPFDVFRQLPNDISETTYSGAVLSLFCAIIMSIFVIAELKIYMNESIHSEMFIDVKKGSEKLQVNIDIVLNKMPCHILSVDVQDILGSHSLNIGGHLFRRRLDKNGKTISDELHISDAHAGHVHGHEDNIDLNDVKQAFLNQEGCQIYGYLLVNRVPGNFHISSHAFGSILGIIMSEVGINSFDNSHIVNHLSFGNDKDLQYVKKQFERGSLNPLDKTKKDKTTNIGTIFQYYVQIVSTIYIDSNGDSRNVYQYTSNPNEMESNMIPALYFKYDFSPMTVKYTKEKEPFTQFLVQICAIIGGIFTILSFLDSMMTIMGRNISRKKEEL